MNNSAMNICVHVSVWTYVFTSLPCGGIAESYGNSTFIFIFLAMSSETWDLSSLTRNQTCASCMGA